MATNEQAQQLGFATPAGTDKWRQGDDVIAQNARAATDRLLLHAQLLTEHAAQLAGVGDAAAAAATAQAAATAAEAAAAAAVDVSGIETTDDAVGALIDNPGVGPRTRAALDGHTGRATSKPLRELSRRGQAVADGPTHAPWVYFGDSMSAMKWTELQPILERTFGGVAGYFGNGIVGTVTAGTVTVNDTDYDVWATGETWTVGAGGSLMWQVGGGNPVCDTIHLFYIRDGAGTFKVQLDGVDVPEHANVDTTGTGQLGVITLDVPRGPHNAGVVRLTGTPTFVPAGFVDSTVSGAIGVPVGKGGLELADFMDTGTALANLGAFLAVVDPAVITFEMREVDHAGLPARLVDLFATFTTNTDADLIGWGVPWDGRTGTVDGTLTFDEWVTTTNAYLRSAVEAAGGTYWDGNTLVPDHDSITAMGWGADPIHPAQGLSKFFLPYINRDLGLLGIGGRPYARDVDAAEVTITDELVFAGRDRTNPEAVLEADAAGNGDLSVKVGRWLRFVSRDYGTEIARFVHNGLTEGWLPTIIRFGNTGAGFRGDYGGAGRLYLVRGDNPSTTADLQCRQIFLDDAGTVRLRANGAALQKSTDAGGTWTTL